MTSLCSIHLQLIIAVLLQPRVGCLKRHGKKRMYFRTFFTLNNTFFATLHIKQQIKCTWVVLERTNNNYMFMYISSELQRRQPFINIATYQDNWQELTIQKNSISLSLSHVNIFHNSCSMSFNMNIFSGSIITLFISVIYYIILWSFYLLYFKYTIQSSPVFLFIN